MFLDFYTHSFWTWLGLNLGIYTVFIGIAMVVAAFRGGK